MSCCYTATTLLDRGPLNEGQERLEHVGGPGQVAAGRCAPAAITSSEEPSQPLTRPAKSPQPSGALLPAPRPMGGRRPTSLTNQSVAGDAAHAQWPARGPIRGGGQRAT